MNNNMELKEILEKLWLAENETQIYMVNLELGMTQVANISRLSGIKRTTLYWILERMEEKWLLKKHVKNNISYYEAIDPDKLYDILEKYIMSLKEKLPELRALDNKFSSKPKIYYFEWAENVAELYKMENNDKPKRVRVFSSNVDRKNWEIDKLRKLRNKIFHDSEKKADMNIILNREPTKSEDSWSKFHPKTIDKKHLDIWISIKIYWNKTKFISMRESVTGVVIENEEIAKTMKSIFDYIYRD